MAKLTKFYFDELNKDQQCRVMIDFRDNGGNLDYLSGKFSRSVVSAEVVVDEDFNLYDIKVFDLYQLVKNDEGTPIYIGPVGWSNWLFEYRDNAGHDVDTILDEFDGVPQDE